MSKVSGDVPGLAPIKRLLNVHGSRSEGLEGDDDVSHMKLCLKIKLNGHMFITIGCLPPGSLLLRPGCLWWIPSVNDVGNIVRYCQVLQLIS